MKRFLLAMASASFGTQAAPILNRSAPVNDVFTVTPDHQDPNLYYVSPQSLRIAADAQGLPEFSYLEYSTSWFEKNAVVQVALKAAYDEAKLEKAYAALRQANPNARFAPMPFVSSHVEFEGSLKALVDSSECDHAAGVVESWQQCSILLNDLGVRAMRRMFSTGLTLTVSFVYEVQGVIQNADGSYRDGQSTLGVAGLIGGAELARHPELFRSGRGREIRL